MIALYVASFHMAVKKSSKLSDLEFRMIRGTGFNWILILLIRVFLVIFKQEFEEGSDIVDLGSRCFV